MRVIYWGTYDLSKPRNRILLAGLREAGVDVIECRAEVWPGITDKSQIRGLATWALIMLRWLFSYPVLVARYLALPRHDAVVVGYLGQVDVLFLWPFARLRGAPIVWDAFLSLYETVSGDRKLIGRKHPLARVLYAIEWLACRAADRVVLDTSAHAAYFAQTYARPAHTLAAVFVGVEPARFARRPRVDQAPPPERPVSVLFFGQFIPLHGIETIVRAAAMARDRAIDWVIVGDGQEAGKIRDMLAHRPVARLSWIPWVEFDALTGLIHQADVCLGIFGDTAKAARVIPNKVYQILATGTPLVTRDSPAIRELLTPDMPGVWLVPPADPAALLAAVAACADQRQTLTARQLHAGVMAQITPAAVGGELARIIDDAVAARAAGKAGRRQRHSETPL